MACVRARVPVHNASVWAHGWCVCNDMTVCGGLPGKESRDLTKTWAEKPAASLSLLSNWMHRHDSWGLSSLAEIMKPRAPQHFDPTT
jgi:hypothetical protein